MNSINLIGRLTREPDSRKTPNGTDVCTMRVAIDRPGEGADYVNVTAFGKLANSVEFLGQRVTQPEPAEPQPQQAAA